MTAAAIGAVFVNVVPSLAGAMSTMATGGAQAADAFTSSFAAATQGKIDKAFKDMPKEAADSFKGFGGQAGKAFLEGFGDLASGQMPDVMKAFDLLEEAAGKVSYLIPALGLAFSALKPVFDTFKAAGGEVAQTLVDIGDQYIEMSRKIASNNIDTSQIKGLLKDVQELAASGAIVKVGDLASDIGRLASNLPNLDNSQLKELTKTFAEAQELVGNFDVTKAAGALNAFNVPAEDVVKTFTELVNINRATGQSFTQMTTEMQNSGPMLRQFGLTMQETAEFFGEMARGGEPASRLTYTLGKALTSFTEAGVDPAKGLNNLVTSVKGMVQDGYLEDATKLLIPIFGSRGAPIMLEDISRGIIKVGEDGTVTINKLQGISSPLSEALEQTKSIGDAFMVVGNQIQAAAAPIGESMAHGLVTAGTKISDWLRDNQDKVIGWSVNISTALLGGFGQSVKFFADILGFFAPAMEKIKEVVLGTMVLITKAIELAMAPLTLLPDKWGAPFRDAEKGMHEATDVMTKGLLTDIVPGIDKMTASADKFADVTIRKWQEGIRGVGREAQASAEMTKAFSENLTGHGEEDAFKLLTDQAGNYGGTGLGQNAIQLVGSGQQWNDVKRKLHDLGIDIAVSASGLITDVAIHGGEKAQEQWDKWLEDQRSKKPTVQLGLKPVGPDGTENPNSGDLVTPGTVGVTVLPSGIPVPSSASGNVGVSPSGVPSPTSSGVPSPASASGPTTASQDQVASMIIDEAKRRGLNPQQTVAAIATALQETGLGSNPRTNQAQNQSGTVVQGLYQQDSSYTKYGDRTNLQNAITGFIDQYVVRGGLTNPNPYQAALDVQRPAAAGAGGYDAGTLQANQGANATAIYNRLANAPGSSPSTPAYVTPADPTQVLVPAGTPSSPGTPAPSPGGTPGGLLPPMPPGAPPVAPGNMPDFTTGQGTGPPAGPVTPPPDVPGSTQPPGAATVPASQFDASNAPQLPQGATHWRASSDNKSYYAVDDNGDPVAPEAPRPPSPSPPPPPANVHSRPTGGHPGGTGPGRGPWFPGAARPAGPDSGPGTGWQIIDQNVVQPTLSWLGNAATAVGHAANTAGQWFNANLAPKSAVQPGILNANTPRTYYPPLSREALDKQHDYPASNLSRDPTAGLSKETDTQIALRELFGFADGGAVGFDGGGSVSGQTLDPSSPLYRGHDENNPWEAHLPYIWQDPSTMHHGWNHLQRDIWRERLGGYDKQQQDSPRGIFGPWPMIGKGIGKLWGQFLKWPVLFPQVGHQTGGPIGFAGGGAVVDPLLELMAGRHGTTSGGGAVIDPVLELASELTSGRSGATSGGGHYMGDATYGRRFGVTGPPWLNDAKAQQATDTGPYGPFGPGSRAPGPGNINPDVQIDTSHISEGKGGSWLGGYFKRLMYLLDVGGRNVPRVMPRYESGGDVPWLPGSRMGEDSIFAALTPGEHVWTGHEVSKAGGHGAMHLLRDAVKQGKTLVPHDSGTMTFANDDVGVNAQLKYIEQIANSMGLTLTAGQSGHGTHDVDKGFHDSGQAGDFSNSTTGNTPQELGFAQYMYTNFGSELAELIYDDPGMPKLIKDGSSVEPLYYGATTLSEHKNHVHVAIKTTQALTSGGGLGSPGTNTLVAPGQPNSSGSSPGSSSGIAAFAGGVPGITGPTGPVGPGYNPWTNMPPGLTGTQQQSYTSDTMGWQARQHEAQVAVTTATENQATAQADLATKTAAAATLQGNYNTKLAELQRLANEAKQPLVEFEKVDPGKTLFDELVKITAKITEANAAVTAAGKAKGTADEAVIRADEAAGQAANTPAPKPPKAEKETPDKNAEQLGQGLVKGIFQELGFPDVFGKDPTQWGIWKTAMAGLGFGAGLLQKAQEDPSGGSAPGQANTGQSVLQGMFPNLAKIFTPQLDQNSAAGPVLNQNTAPPPPGIQVGPAAMSSQTPANTPDFTTGKGSGPPPGPGVVYNQYNNGVMTPPQINDTVNHSLVQTPTPQLSGGAGTGR